MKKIEILKIICKINGQETVAVPATKKELVKIKSKKRECGEQFCCETYIWVMLEDGNGDCYPFKTEVRCNVDECK